MFWPWQRRVGIFYREVSDCHQLGEGRGPGWLGLGQIMRSAGWDGLERNCSWDGMELERVTRSRVAQYCLHRTFYPSTS